MLKLPKPQKKQRGFHDGGDDDDDDGEWVGYDL